MKLLNYTTTVSAEKTVGEIQRKLATAGASQILHGYDKNANLNELSFRIKTQFGEMAFRLPANIEAVEAILLRQFKRRNAYSSREQATRVAWRILKDWIEAQLALLQTGQVTIEQAFLAYMQNDQGVTVYEALREKRFAGLLHENTRTTQTAD